MRDDLDTDEDPWDGTAETVEQHLETWANELFPDQALVLIDAVGMIVPELVVESERLGEPTQVYSLCREAMGIVRDLDVAMHCEAFPKEGRSRVWRHLPKPTFGTTYQHGVEKDLLQNAAADYLARPWMHHDYFDWCIVDALAHCELNAFAHHLFLRMAQIYFGLAVVIIVMMADLAVRVFEGKEVLAGWPFALLIIMSLAAVPSFVRIANRRPLLAMNWAYEELDGVVLSPARVREQFRAAEKHGVVWPRAIWPILDAAVARNATIWNVRQS
jgi:uncharacterized membrane protein (DUF485 family)